MNNEKKSRELLEEMYTKEQDNKKKEAFKIRLELLFVVLFAGLIAFLMINGSRRKITDDFNQAPFEVARLELKKEKERNVINAAKQLLQDNDQFLIDLQNENLQSITESDLDYLRSTRDIILEPETSIVVPPFLDNDIDVLVIHVSKAIGNDDYSFTAKDLETLKRISRILSENEATIQMGDGQAPLHLLEYKVASRIN